MVIMVSFQPFTLIFNNMQKFSLLFVFVGMLGFQPSQAQVSDADLQKNSRFTGAVADAKEHRAIFQLDTNNPDIIRKTFRNIRNVLKDERLKGRLTLELVTFSGGTDVMRTKSPYADDLKDLISKGVQVSQCTNSLAERKLTKQDILPFVGFVPSGNGELIIRSAQGWAVIKP